MTSTPRGGIAGWPDTSAAGCEAGTTQKGMLIAARQSSAPAPRPTPAGTSRASLGGINTGSAAGGCSTPGPAMPASTAAGQG